MIGERYRHYKNQKEYIVIALGKNHDTLGDVVVYQGDYDDPKFGHHPVWVREIDDFTAMVDKDGQMVARFERIVADF